MTAQTIGWLIAAAVVAVIAFISSLMVRSLEYDEQVCQNCRRKCKDTFTECPACGGCPVCGSDCGQC